MQNDFENNGKFLPKQLGYSFPAEFSTHKATWLSWPHNEKTWPGKIETIYPTIAQFIYYLSISEEVHINVNSFEMKAFAMDFLNKENCNFNNIIFHLFPTNDAWCRDHGPAFLTKPASNYPKTIVSWNYNAWGNKYPFELDDKIPFHIGEYLKVPVFYPNIVMEGGSVDFNGKGSLITSSACLLNPNRNPSLNKKEIEEYLRNYYGVEQILWVPNGIEGDDTDGHIDDTVRFINHDTVLAVYETNKSNFNFHPLDENINVLKNMRLINGQKLNIVHLPMPSPKFYQNTVLPCSYANFYICNKFVIVPIFEDKNDELALKIIADCFPDKQIIGLNSLDLIWGLGSFHCLSQQEPL